MTEQINTPKDLTALAAKLEVRPDWHEPDEQAVNAHIRGMHLDNAMGSTVCDIGENNEYGEFNVVVTRDGTDVAVINLATLLSWGAKLGASDERETAASALERAAALIEHHAARTDIGVFTEHVIAEHGAPLVLREYAETIREDDDKYAAYLAGETETISA